MGPYADLEVTGLSLDSELVLVVGERIRLELILTEIAIPGASAPLFSLGYSILEMQKNCVANGSICKVRVTAVTFRSNSVVSYTSSTS